MAAVAQYYSDNLRSEVLKGMDEKVRQGWPTGLAPYGYINVEDKGEPVQPHPEKAKSLVRMFELYSAGGFTFESLADVLVHEGHIFRPSQPRFHRTALSYILGNRFYVGELHRNGQVFEGRYKRLIDRTTFDACHDIMNGRNRRTGSSDPDQSNTTLTYAWDLDGDSVYGETGSAAARGDETGMKPTFSAAGLNSAGPITVSLRVTDAGGLPIGSSAMPPMTSSSPARPILTLAMPLLP